MDEMRRRAVIREEITLAVKTWADAALDLSYSRASEGRDVESSALDAFHSASLAFSDAYEANCAVADEQRAEAAKNPFAEPEGEAVDPAVQALVKGEVLSVLRDLRSAFYMSGLDDDYRIAERLDGVISARERAASE